MIHHQPAALLSRKDGRPPAVDVSGAEPAGVTPRRIPGMPGWLAAGLLTITGCQGDRVQSMLHPVSETAARIADIWWLMFVVLTAITVLVIGALLWGIFHRESSALGDRFVIVTGIVLPAIVLVGLLLVTLDTSRFLRDNVRAAERGEPDLTLRVIGHQYWWEVIYPDHDVITANELHIPSGTPVRIELRSDDVIHSLWVPQLNGKMDMLPEKDTVFWLQADRPGQYRGQCAEFCGLQHARMAFVVVAYPPEDFEAWIARKQRPHREPDTELTQRGKDVFFEARCHNCHAIRGTPARSRTGPDLTHFGKRFTIGAGQFPNTVGWLTGWIANPQALKPGNKMPRTHFVPSDDLHALVEYLMSLE